MNYVGAAVPFACVAMCVGWTARIVKMEPHNIHPLAQTGSEEEKLRHATALCRINLSLAGEVCRYVPGDRY